jgi:hypothetical protein
MNWSFLEIVWSLVGRILKAAAKSINHCEGFMLHPLRDPKGQKWIYNLIQNTYLLKKTNI